ncbi:MAG: mandelate racemase/muconate lactonizing enzyme family protein [Actinomycetota bacterium]|nr:mandelate racemase/muconate lactonizing enzyme family protein [Actinomycetota bacterium]
MKIDRIDAWICHFPLPAPFSPSWVPGLANPNNSAIVYRLRTDEGLDGYAGWVAFADEPKGPVNLMRAFLLGRDPTRPSELRPMLESAVRVLGLRVWFVETALYDLAAKAAGLPLYRYLGGARDRVQAYASFGELRDGPRRAEDTLAAKELGFSCVKLRPRHPTMREDIEEVRIVRAAVGDDFGIACDANQGWRVDTFAQGPKWDFKRALATAKAYEEFGVAWLEEPLDQFAFDDYKRLRDQTTTPIAGGELAGDVWPVRELIERRAVDIVQPDPTFTGGITGALGLARMAEQFGIGFQPHAWSNGLGFAASLHVLAASNGALMEYPYDPPGWVPEGRDAMLAEPFRVDADGWITLPTGPGLGVELDLERIEAHGDAI